MMADLASEFGHALEFHQAGQLDEAERGYRGILAHHPDHADTLHHLAILLSQRGNHSAAEPLMQRSLQLIDHLPQWHGNFAMLCWNLGRLDEAIVHLRRGVELNPRDVAAHIDLGRALADSGQENEAMAALERAVQLQPHHVNALSSLAFLLQRQRNFARAAELCRKSLEMEPNSAALLNQLSGVLHALGDLDGSIAAAQKATLLDPNHVEAWTNLGLSQIDLGDATLAARSFRKALEVQPENASARSNLLVALHSDPNVDRATMFEEHRKYQRFCVDSLNIPSLKHLIDRDPDRPLRIAYVSPDFRRHPVASFIDPVLRSHDRSKFIVSCYADERARDDVTERLCKLPSHWYDISYLNDEQLARKINDNREDILIDLAGHTANNRLLAFAFKPSPVQLTYLGYLNTTGLSAMDFRITDAVVDPPGEADGFYSEKLLRLQCFFCYQPPAEAPAVTELPAKKGGEITFGSMNHPAKFNSHVVDLWARLLQTVRNSRLMLIASPGAGERRLRDLFTQRGIAADRLIVNHRRLPADYYALYRSIDIALDPFPFNGHTTTCDTLWMGVPVVTIAGNSYSSRTCTATLTHLGMPELIARDADHYVQIAAELARDLARLVELRASLRQRMHDSTITNAATFTANLEQAYRHVWQEWTKRQTA